MLVTLPFEFSIEVKHGTSVPSVLNSHEIFPSTAETASSLLLAFTTKVILV